MLKKPLSFIAYLSVLVILGLGVRHFAINPIQEASKAAAASLFSASMMDSNGIKQSLGQYRGKIIVLNFWATWCPPCREEMPELSQLHQQYQNSNVMVLGIAEDELAPVREFLQASPVSYPVFIAENEHMELGASLGNHKAVLPYTVIIDANGNVLQSFFGKINKPLLEKSLQNILQHQ